MRRRENVKKKRREEAEEKRQTGRGRESKEGSKEKEKKVGRQKKKIKRWRRLGHILRRFLCGLSRRYAGFPVWTLQPWTKNRGRELLF